MLNGERRTARASVRENGATQSVELVGLSDEAVGFLAVAAAGLVPAGVVADWFRDAAWGDAEVHRRSGDAVTGKIADTLTAWDGPPQTYFDPDRP